jgi:hypothetical protein
MARHAEPRGPGRGDTASAVFWTGLFAKTRSGGPPRGSGQIDSLGELFASKADDSLSLVMRNVELADRYRKGESISCALDKKQKPKAFPSAFCLRLDATRPDSWPTAFQQRHLRVGVMHGACRRARRSTGASDTCRGTPTKHAYPKPCEMASVAMRVMPPAASGVAVGNDRRAGWVTRQNSLGASRRNKNTGCNRQPIGAVSNRASAGVVLERVSFRERAA